MPYLVVMPRGILIRIVCIATQLLIAIDPACAGYLANSAFGVPVPVEEDLNAGLSRVIMPQPKAVSVAAIVPSVRAQLAVPVLASLLTPLEDLSAVAARAPSPISFPRSRERLRCEIYIRHSVLLI
jgi:hypothetical protein